MTSFGNRLRQLRIRADLRQDELVQLAGLKGGASKISRAEKDAAALSRDDLMQILAVLSRRTHITRVERQGLFSAYLSPEETPPTSEVVGLSVPRVGDSAFWSLVIGAITEELYSRNFHVILCQHDEDVSKQCEQIDYFVETLGVAGVILAPAVGLTQAYSHFQDSLHVALKRLADAGMAAVLIDRQPTKKQPFPYVGIQNEVAGERAAKTFLELGHTQIGALLALETSSAQRERRDGFQRVLRAAGHFNPELILFGAEVRHEQRRERRRLKGIRDGHALALKLLSNTKSGRPTALFCGAYYMALETLRAVETLKSGGHALSVPRDISIIGFDNVRELDIPTSKVARMEYPVDALANSAVSKLMALIRDPLDRAANMDCLLPTEYVPGDTVAGPSW